jgi:primosomal protein N''
MSEQADLLLPTAKQPVLLNTAHARDMLQKRYPAGEWALLEEVAPATGGGTRYADAVAVNLWQSRGHAVHGFEIKVGRGDWLKELKDPSKAEPVYRYCDHWWIVAPKGIVKDGELPPTWGLLELRESGLTQVVNAPKLEPQPLNRAFFASLMRRGHAQIEALAERKHHTAIVRARVAINEQVQQGIEQSTRRHKELQDKVAKFEAETGLSFNSYSGPPAEAIKLALALQKLEGYSGDRRLRQLTYLAEQLEHAAKTVHEAVAHTKLQQEAVHG